MNYNYSIEQVFYRDILEAMQFCKSSMFDSDIWNQDSLEQLAKKYSENAHVAVVKVEDNIAGYVAFYCNDMESKTAYISMIVVKSEYQGLHLGGKLLDYVVSISKEKGMCKIKLEVAKENKKATGFYIHKGFVFKNEASEHSDYYILDI